MKTYFENNSCCGQEASLRTEYGETKWFPTDKCVRLGCILCPYLFKLYVKYIIQKVGLDSDEGEVRNGGRNINTLRYTGTTILLAEKNNDLNGGTLKEKVQKNVQKMWLWLFSSTSGDATPLAY